MSPADLLAQLRFARAYTSRALDATPLDDWLRIPPAGVTHIAWQVGHLAVATYSLALQRQRGRLPEDESLVPEAFLRAFARQSSPTGEAAGWPPDQVHLTYHHVHDQVEREWPWITAAGLDSPLDRLHPICRTRRDCLAWVGQHELIHAGQISLLRRQLGHPPIW